MAEASPAVVNMLNADRHACDHEGVGPRDHRCPKCTGIMRRCCDSLVGLFNHRPGCYTYEIPEDEGETIVRYTLRPPQ